MSDTYPGAWGRGTTEVQATAEWRKAGGRGGRVVYRIHDVYVDPYVDFMGSVWAERGPKSMRDGLGMASPRCPSRPTSGWARDGLGWARDGLGCPFVQAILPSRNPLGLRTGWAAWAGPKGKRVAIDPGTGEEPTAVEDGDEWPGSGVLGDGEHPPVESVTS